MVTFYFVDLCFVVILYCWLSLFDRRVCGLSRMRRKRLIRATTGLAIIGFGSPGKRSATGEYVGCGPGRDSVIPRPDYHHFVAVMLTDEAVSLRQAKRCLLTCAQGRVTGAELSQRLPVLQSLRRLAVDVLPVHV